IINSIAPQPANDKLKPKTMSRIPPIPTHASAADRRKALTGSLYAIARIGDQSESPEAALDRILHEILAVIPADAAAIALKNPDSELFDLRILNRCGTPADSVELPPGVGVAGWVALHGQPLSIPDLHTDSRFLSILPHSR